MKKSIKNTVAAVEDGAGVTDRKLMAKNKIAADTARYEALAREHGADLSEDGFNVALTKVARHRAEAAASPSSKKL